MLLIKEHMLAVEKVNGVWPAEAKEHAAVVLLTTGNLRQTEKVTGIPYDTLTKWAKADDWDVVMANAKRTRAEQIQRRLYTLNDLALEKIQDRLENGDWVLNNKTGELIRKPVSIRDVTRLMETSLGTALKVDASQREVVKQESAADLLKSLAAEFAKFSKPKGEVIDVEFKEI